MSIESILWTSISQPASQTQPIAGYFIFFCDSRSEYYLGKSHDRCEITETQKWITSNGSFSKSLCYAEQNEYLQHTLDKYFPACVVDTTYNGLLIYRYSLRLRLVLPSGCFANGMTQIVVPQW